METIAPAGVQSGTRLAALLVFPVLLLADRMIRWHQESEVLKHVMTNQAIAVISNLHHAESAMAGIPRALTQEDRAVAAALVFLELGPAEEGLHIMKTYYGAESEWGIDHEIGALRMTLYRMLLNEDLSEIGTLQERMARVTTRVAPVKPGRDFLNQFHQAMLQRPQ